MSLMMWLPMDGKNENLSIIETKATWSTAPTYVSNGKIGKGVTTGQAYVDANVASQILTYKFSYCAWIKVLDTNNRSMIFGNDSMGSSGNSNNRHYSLFQYPTANDLHWSWQNDATSSAQGSVVCGGAQTGFFPTGEWVHLAVTYGDGYFRVYRNGSLYYESANSAFKPSSFKYATTIFSGNASRITNDIRVYNHVLSKREVWEISKGLCLHFKLDNKYNSSITNLYQSYRIGNLPWRSGYFTQTIKQDTDGTYYTNYKLSYTGTGSNTWASISAPSFSFVADNKYWWRSKIRVNGGNHNAYIRRARISNDWEANYFTINHSNTGNGWVENYASYTLKTTDTRSSTSITTAPLMEIYTDNMPTSGTVYTLDFDIKDISIYKSNEYVGYVDNSLNSSSIDDCSGLQRNGTIVGSVLPSNTATRYGHSMIVDGTNYITANGYNLDAPFNTQNFSVSYWIYPTNIGTEWQTPFCIGASAATSSFLLCHIKSTGVNMAFYSNDLTGSYTFSNNKWYHLVYEANSGNRYVYVNGSMLCSGTYTTNLTIGTSPKVGVGKDPIRNSYAYSGLISDVRVYATCLSSADVVSLYSTRAEIDKASNFYGGFLSEVTSASINKSGIVNASQFNEMNIAFDTNIYVEPDGSAWVRIFHHNNPASYIFSSADTFTSCVRKDDNRWFNVAYCNSVNQNGKWELMIKQKATSASTETKYRWIQSVNPATTTTSASVASASITKISTDGYTVSSYGGLFKYGVNTYLCANNGNTGNWWGAVGSWTQHQGGIPAYNAVVVTTGYMDLYIRIDALTTDSLISTASISKSGQISGKEVKEY